MTTNIQTAAFERPREMALLKPARNLRPEDEFQVPEDEFEMAWHSHADRTPPTARRSPAAKEDSPPAGK